MAEAVSIIKSTAEGISILTRTAGFDVARTGVASVGFIGFPSVGKSTLMSRLTGQHSEGRTRILPVMGDEVDVVV